MQDSITEEDPLTFLEEVLEEDSPTEFDMENEDHHYKLKKWCLQHMVTTIIKGAKGFNKVSYHDCCFCFTKRRFTPISKHPETETQSITKIPTLKDLTAPIQLYEWIISRMQAHKKDGRKIYFPTVNTIHREDKSETIKSMRHEIEMLGKRNEDLQRKNYETLIELEKIKRDNKKLHASTQDWYTKYNNAMSLIESRTNLFKMNPYPTEITFESTNSPLFNS